MKFTLVFPSHESCDLSIGLLFTPCAEWNIGGKTLFVPHAENPHYLPGDFQELVKMLDAKDLLSMDIAELQGKTIFIIVTNTGHGTEQYLRDLETDAANFGMNPVIIRDNNK